MNDPGNDSGETDGRTGRRTFHGRRQGRPLRQGLKTLLRDRLPAMSVAWPAGQKIDATCLFEPPRGEVWLEIGFGGGEHLAWQATRQAALESDVGIIGAEVFLNGIATLLRALEDPAAADRVRIYRGDARDLLEALQPACLNRVFILFPDPWPKKRHHKRRIIQAATLDRLAQVMRPGAELRLASDEQSYLDWMMVHLSAHPRFEWPAASAADWRCRPDDWPPTRYERKALAAGRKMGYLRFLRVV